jgi:hypothetical protein
MAMKIRFLVEGDELPGLTKFGAVPLENGTIDVPTFNRILKIDNGVTTMPTVPCTFETRRNTITRKFLTDWKDKHEKHDVTIIKCDAGGVEFARDLWQDVECNKREDPEVDLASVSYARMDVVFLPYSIDPVEV